VRGELALVPEPGGSAGSGGWAVPMRVKLAAVKTGLFNPRLPSLRRMDTDDAMRKLPTEHSRHSTNSTGFAHTGGSLTVNDIFSPDGKRSMYQKRELEKPWSNYRPLLTEAAQDWSTFISRCGEFRIPCEASRELHYSGYAVRYLKPNVTQSWRYSLQSEPTLTQYDQMPIPVIFSGFTSRPWY
uniref:Uncharacterized protein n=1 Tax=Callorhinchus milii TaxID=7868 RepID=A0A4W3H5V0_CALMI